MIYRGPWVYNATVKAIVDATGELVVRRDCFTGPHQEDNFLLVLNAPVIRDALNDTDYALGMEPDELGREKLLNDATTKAIRALDETVPLSDRKD